MHETMRTIGVRELKAHLSRILRDVQRGEHYLVTDRGRVVAELREPGASPAANLSASDVARLRLVASGELRVAERPRAPMRRTGVALPEGTAKEAIDWVRGER
jgi:antitoxin (DNA-binding transcriptional repressor) of toxin-antitoxin stability system